MPRIFTLAACLLFAYIPVASAELPEGVSKLLRASNIPEDSLGVFAIRLTDNTTLLSHGANRSLQPASTMKLVTTLVALETFGPIFRGRTELRAAGQIQDGVLQGDLVVRGVGDGDLTWEAFYGMLQTLRQKGVRDIRGNVIIDRQFFNPARLDIGLPPFDETPEFRYNVIPDALLLNTNLVKLEFESDAHSLGIRMTPELEGVKLDVGLGLIDRKCEDWEDGWKTPTVEKTADGTLLIKLSGDFPRKCATSTHISVLDRVDFADRLFRSLWRYLGGTFNGTVGDGTSPPGTRVLAEHRSRPLGEILRDINKPSDNPLARLLFLTLGARETNGSGPTLARAEQEVRTWFKAHGIDDQGLVLENGSGLSRKERITPMQLAGLLQAGYRGNWAPEFMASLPIAAMDGTMRRRLQKSPAAERARLKTGTLKDVVAVAGYVPDADNQPCILVAMVNHDFAKSNVGRPIIDALVDWVARSNKNAAGK